MNSDEFEGIINFIREGNYPPEAQASRQTKWNYKKRSAPYFIGESNRLFKRIKVKDTEEDLEVPLMSQLDDTYRKFHDQVGHPGINTTLSSVQQRYTWAGIGKDVREYVKTCHICQMTAALPPQPQKKLQPIPPPTKTWKHIGMDLICDLCESEDGYKHVLVIVCYLSKYVVVRPLKTKTSEEVIQNLKDVYLDMGLPDIIQHDQGKEFTSNMFQEFHKKLDIDDRSTRPYHPMANGLVEAHNKILKTKLTKMEIETGDHWCKLLKSAVIAMNSTKKRAHGQSAFKVMWGRESRHQDLLSVINNLETNTEEDFELEESIFAELLTDTEELLEDIFSPPLDNPQEEVDIISESRTSTQQSAMDSINYEQLKQKIQYDKKVNEGRASLEIEEKFIYTNMPKLKHLPKTKKQAKYLGPYTVSKVTDSHVTISKDEIGAKKDKKIARHIARPYFERCTELQTKEKSVLDVVVGVNTLQTCTNLFGFTTESIFGHLETLKEILRRNAREGTFMTPLHEELYNKLSVANPYTPNTHLFQFLNGSTEEKIKRDILATVLDWTPDLLPTSTDTQRAKYTHKVLYFVAIQYLNTILWESFDETAANRVLNTFPDDPRISVIDETWQRSKCDLLGLKFTSVCRQPDYLVGRHLRDYEPWEREEIEGDGNCLFRCFSKLISGSEESHLQLRSIISRFIASEGTRRLGWYFISKKTTPCNYLTCERLIFRESVWGTDVEILAASAILDADIYVANNFYRTQGSLTRVTRWSLLRAQDNSTGTLYITNYGHHYEPVINMLNSSTPTYGSGTTSDVVQLIE